MRKSMAFPVRFVAEGQVVQTTSRDLDEESVFVRCVEPPSEGEKVSLRLYLPGLDDVEAIPAQVVESSPEGFRARFVALDRAQLERIAQAVEIRAAGVPPSDPILPFAGENRRVLPRFLERFRVTVGTDGRKESLTALNVSASGLFIRTEAPPAIDQIVQVVLELPDGKPPAEAQAIVVHRVLPGEDGAAGAGVQFIAADDDFRARLDSWLATLKASGSRPSR